MNIRADYVVRSSMFQWPGKGKGVFLVTLLEELTLVYQYSILFSGSQLFTIVLYPRFGTGWFGKRFCNPTPLMLEKATHSLLLG